MKLSREAMKLYVVTDRSWLAGRRLEEDVEATLKGGATFIQIREKELDFGHFFEEAVKIKALTKKYNVPYVINDNVDLAIACDADGVHVGQSDMEAENVRARLGEGKIIGVSVQTVEQALLAEKQGADYLGVGTVFPTSTKLDAEAVKRETVREICEAVNIPVIAIGGISSKNIMELAGTKIDGVAVISAIFAQPDITQATKELLTLSEKMINA